MLKKCLIVGGMLFTLLYTPSVEEGAEKPTPEIKIVHTETKLGNAVTVQANDSKPKGQLIRMEVTGYTAGYESTQKHKGEKGYGITTSGAYVKQGVTVAAGKNIPLGTKIYIPYFDGKPGFGDGYFIVQDRGGAIGPYNIDVYYNSVQDARNFGRQLLDVYILEE